jgi:CspA family cold shock protein
VDAEAGSVSFAPISRRAQAAISGADDMGDGWAMSARIAANALRRREDAHRRVPSAQGIGATATGDGQGDRSRQERLRSITCSAGRSRWSADVADRLRFRQLGQRRVLPGAHDARAMVDARHATWRCSAWSTPSNGPCDLQSLFGSTEVNQMATGTVSRVVADRGFGFITAEDDKEYFFHRSSLDATLDFDRLRGGEKVEFEVEASPKGPRATQVRAA